MKLLHGTGETPQSESTSQGLQHGERLLHLLLDISLLPAGTFHRVILKVVCVQPVQLLYHLLYSEVIS